MLILDSDESQREEGNDDVIMELIDMRRHRLSKNPIKYFDN